MKILVPVGTRPEIIKLAPVIRALKLRSFDVTTVATGQHYDASLTSSLESLDVGPDARWQATGTDGERFGRILSRAFCEIAARRPDLVLLLGDTYTVPLFCLAARHYQVPIAHLEAGMRSFNQTSIEESNRRLASAVASLHLTATESDARFLAAEGVAPARIRVVGNPVIDAICQLDVPRVAPAGRHGIVVTVHRRSNVEDPQRLAAVVELLGRLADLGDPVTFPVHPRTRVRLTEAGAIEVLARRGVRLLPPLPYEEMLALLSAARVIVTDSGGLQEEGAWFGVPVVVLRRSTPRWDGVRAGIAVLCGLEVEVAVSAVRLFSTPEEQVRVASVPCPYGDGKASQRVGDLLTDPGVLALLQLDEPDFVGRMGPQ